MITAHHIFAAFVIAAAYGLLCLVKPTRNCGRCKGTRRSKRYLGLAGPEGKCRRCSGNGKHPRLGASAVHWFAWSVVVERLVQRRHERLVQRRYERRQDRGQQFTTAPRTAGRTAWHAAARQRAARRADRLIAFQAWLGAAPGWSFA